MRGKGSSPVAASLAAAAAAYLNWILDHLAGTTNAALESGRVRLIDRFWVRRAYAQLRIKMHDSGLPLGNQVETSDGGRVDLIMRVPVGNNSYIGLECQRTQVSGGDRGPFTISLLAGPVDTTGWPPDQVEAECIRTAESWRDVLDPAPLLERCPEVGEIATPLGAGGFRSGPRLEHPYYGWRHTGFGSRLRVTGSATYGQLEHIVWIIARYLLDASRWRGADGSAPELHQGPPGTDTEGQ